MSYLKTKTHISWVLTAICVGFLGGVVLSTVIREIEPPIIWLALAIICILTATISRWRLLIPVAIMAGCLLGVWRSVPLLADLDNYKQYIGNEVTIVGTIADDPTVNRRDITVNLTDIALSDGVTEKQLSGKLWITITSGAKANIRRYDQVQIIGTLDSGFGSYVAIMRRAKLVQINSLTGSDPMGEVRARFNKQLSKVMDSNQVGLGMGLLTGQKSALDDDLQTAFVAASLTHILVASGYNLTVLIRFARRLLGKRSRLLALIISATLVVLFANMTGLSASMNRAMLVALISLLLWYVGRRAHPIVLLSVSAAITIAINPTQLWGDVGWYLSFGSFAGVIILAPLVNDLVSSRNGLVQILIETGCAQAATIPIVALFMGNISIVGLLTNILVLPLLPLAMLLTFIAGIAATILPLTLAGIMVQPATWLLDFIIGVAKWGGQLPFASVEFRPDMALVITYYAILMVLAVGLKVYTGHNFYGDNMIE
ncbi:MAG: ComEC/Rec2 family competence protein [Candidatus Saccharibacteria bacterium]|nr:ComEC/Rec2 family competence protein [Candidatus Saccharibacteria bacterium]